MRFRKELGPLVSLFLLSLVIRLVFLSLMIRSNATNEVWDAYGYFFRAIGFQQIMFDLLQGQLPSSDSFWIAYSNHWPPLQALLLALGFTIFGSTVTIGQGIMVLLSALTTPLVYLVTSKLSGRRAAILASLVFAIYPSFIHLSLRLLSETTYIFLSFLIFYFALIAVEVNQARKAFLIAALVGFLLGISTLTRAAALPWIPIFASWIAWNSREKKFQILLPIVILIVCGITLLPWEIALYKVENRFVMVATSGDENLYRGNNPWIPDGFGSYGSITMPYMREAAAEYMDQYQVSDKEAYRELALQEIKGAPVKFIERGFYKLRELWSIDDDIYLFIVTVIYPPVNNAWAGIIFGINTIALPLSLAGGIWGLLIPDPCLRARMLIVGLIVSSVAVVFVTIGEEARFHLPLLAVLLPAIGHGLAHLTAIVRRPLRIYTLISVLMAVSLGFSIITRLPVQYSIIAETKPSSHYLPLIRQVDNWLGREITPVSDRFLFRVNRQNYPEELTFSIVGTEYKFMGIENQTFQWHPSDEPGTLNLVVYSSAATTPFELHVSSESAGDFVVSLGEAPWQSWSPTPIPDLEYMWIGSSRFPGKSNIGRTIAKQPGDWDKLIIPETTELSWSFKRYD
jgi:4-amino-4-deoxy-L-arabinose transferase-like glycosyltransferase